MKTIIRTKPTEAKDSRNEIRLDYNINYFYGNFIKEHKYIDSLEGKLKRDKVLTFLQYKAIIKTYFKIYFYELFYGNKPLYFCLTGKLIKVRTTDFVINGEKMTPAIAVLWYHRVLRTMYLNCRLQLLRGSSSCCSQIRQQWAKENDLGLLPMIRNKKSELRDNNLMYQHDDKRTIFFQPNP